MVARRPRGSPSSASVDKDGRPQPPQIYVIAMAGGEPRALTDIPRGAGNPEWSPDGKTIAFASGTRPEDDLPSQGPEGGKAARERRPRHHRARSIAPTASPGSASSIRTGRRRSGPSRWRPTATDLATPKRITSGEFAAGNHRWSADGAQIYFVSDRRRESVLPARTTAICTRCRKDGGEPARIASIDGGIGAYSIVARRQAHRVRRHAGTAARTVRTASRICGSSIVPVARRAT